MAQVDFADTIEPTCPICRQLLPSVANEVLTKAPDWCWDIERVRTFPGLHRGRLDGIHAAGISGVLLRYRVPPQYVKCIYGHDHHNGALVRFLCGFIVPLGHECASKTVANWDQIGDEIVRLDKRADNLKDLGLAPEVIARATATYRQVETLGAAGRSLDTGHFSGIRAKIPDNGEVHETCGHKYRGRIIGRELFKVPETNTIRQKTRELMEATSSQGAMDDDTVARVAYAVRHLQSLAKTLERWVANASMFFDTGNLQLVLVAVGPTRVRVVEGRLVDVHAGVTYSVGANGVRKS